VTFFKNSHSKGWDYRNAESLTELSIEADARRGKVRVFGTLDPTSMSDTFTDANTSRNASRNNSRNPSPANSSDELSAIAEEDSLRAPFWTLSIILMQCIFCLLFSGFFFFFFFAIRH
jgi:hypothetical protein